MDSGKTSRMLEDGQTAGKGRVTYERGFHSEEDRMALTGQSTRESHQIYSHADDKAGQAAIAKLPRVTAEKP